MQIRRSIEIVTRRKIFSMPVLYLSAFEKYASSHKGVSDNLDAWIRDVGIYSRLRGRRSAHVSHAGADGTRGDLENS